MAGTTGSLPRKVFVAVVAILGCMALVLFCSRLVAAQPTEASWYGPGFEGNLTANGEVFDPSGYTAAHKTYEFGTKLIVTYEGRSMVVRINDRGPYVAGRELDLAQGAAEYIGLTAVGVDVVDVQVADPSTPVGPYAPRSQRASASPAQQNNPANSANGSGQQGQNEPAQQPNGNGANGSGGSTNAAQAVEDQYAAEDQYVDENQGQQVTEPAPPAPKPAVPVLPPEPEPEALISPPEELAVPNSTVQQRVEFEIAAKPTPQPLEQEAPEPPAEPSAEEPEEELTVLPDTGGAPLSLPVAGGLLIALGIAVRLWPR